MRDVIDMETREFKSNEKNQRSAPLVQQFASVLFFLRSEMRWWKSFYRVLAYVYEVISYYIPELGRILKNLMAVTEK